MKGNASAATWKGRWLACLAAAVASALCLLAASGLASAAQPSLDLSKPSSLKVTAALEDAASFTGPDAGIQVDAYLVARAEQVPGYDTYAYAPVEGGPFANLDVAALNKAMESGDGATATQASQQFAQAALSAALADLRSPEPTLANAPHASMHAAGGVDAPCEADFDRLPSGLYLLVAHGADLSADDYATTLADGKTATVAYSALKECAFEPVLVSLPTREAAAGQVLTTASGADWRYSVHTMLKPQVSPRMGSLEIIKTLDRFETDGTGVDSAATFVFSVQAVDVDGEKVYDDVVSIVFDQPGRQSVLIENKIPAGATVTVREVYSGASYQVAGASEGTAVIAADQVAQVSFANTDDTTKVHGGSVTNSFAYGKGGWELTPAYSHGAAASED
ncbi:MULTISPECIES: DUF5979 domain-containing protein [unclassified Adlercreutzia]|uniref:DUF5979 domain-containing protein n=1 Tax=unclassified Adlercreutzia TaxID=2636013 RepID=UPI0013EB7B97|nr:MULTISPECIES: DUF5979 domain-containing protein [unclassified Adlercreutzia]